MGRTRDSYQLPKQLFYLELQTGQRNVGASRKHYKDVQIKTLKGTNLHKLQVNRKALPKTVHHGEKQFKKPSLGFI